MEDGTAQAIIVFGFLNEQIKQSASLFARVENGESLLARHREHRVGEGIVGQFGRRVVFRQAVIFDTLESFEMIAGDCRGDDWSRVLKPKLELIRPAQRGLGGGAKDKRAAVSPLRVREFLECVKNGLK